MVPKLFFCDVGQGDATLFIFGSFQMLVDAGPDNSKSMSCLDRYMPWPDKTLELAVVSHFDLDHYGGFIEIMNRYQINDFVRLPFDKSDEKYELFREKFGEINNLSRKPKQVVYDFSKKEYQISEQIFISFWNNYKDNHLLKEFFETESYRDNLSDQYITLNGNNIDQNPLSIAIFIVVNDSMVLITGDMDQKAELALLQSNLLTRLSVLKVAHHGSKTSSARKFIEFLQPEQAVISVGKNNSYGHPQPEVIELLQDQNAQVLRTDELGDIVFEYVHDKWLLTNH